MSTKRPARHFETTLDIAATPDLVWKAISEASELERWFAPSAQVSPGVGGSVLWSWPGLHEWPQTIEVWEPGRRLLTRYDSPVDDGAGGKQPLFVEFSLEGQGGRTRLRLVHSGFGPDADFDGEFDGISRGWMVELRSLRLYLERHAGQERRTASSIRPLDVPLEQAWEQLTGPDGLACGTRIDRLEEGAPFTLAGIEGQVLHCNARELSGCVPKLGDAWLRVTVETCGAQSLVWLTLSTWGRPEEEVARVQVDFEQMLERLFSSEAAEA